MSPTLPLNAVHMAEDAATLDVLTGGNYIPWADLVFDGEQARR
jgi:hypothetical protein